MRIFEMSMLISFVVNAEYFYFSIICGKSDKIMRGNELTKTIVMRVGSRIGILTKRVLIRKLNTIFIFINKKINLFTLKFRIILIFYLNICKKVPCFKIRDFIETYSMIQPSWYKNKRIRLVFINSRVRYKTSMAY